MQEGDCLKCPQSQQRQPAMISKFAKVAIAEFCQMEHEEFEDQSESTGEYVFFPA